MKYCLNKKGFTLLELIISLGIIMLVITSGSLLYFSGQKAWERSEDMLEVQQNLRIAINTLTTAVRKADTVEIYKDEDKIMLYYEDGSSNSYRFDSDSKEIRLAESEATVAMYIEDCQFDYSNDLVNISITTQPNEGSQSKTYTLNINTRGKEVYEY